MRKSQTPIAWAIGIVGVCATMAWSGVSAGWQSTATQQAIIAKCFEAGMVYGNVEFGHGIFWGVRKDCHPK